ncbi:MAG: DUF2189 domain-containing protein [Pseudomonadota bacterium]
MSDTATMPRPSGPTVNTIYRDRPWVWLAQGWRDLWAAPGVGLVWGLIFALVGVALTVLSWVYEVYYLTYPLMAGFLLFGPIVAVGLYDTSRRLAAGQPVSFGQSLRALRTNTGQILLIGVALLLISIAWVRFASLLFMLFFFEFNAAPEPMSMLQALISVEAIPFLIVGNAIGAVLALITFAVAAISIPLLLDRPDAHVMTAIYTSWRAVTQNFWTMILWAWLIAIFIGIGLATAFVGLIVTLPLIGHATWAAYKDLVTWPDE